MHIMSLCIRVSQTDIGTNPDRHKLDNQMQKDTQKERHADRQTERHTDTETQSPQGNTVAHNHEICTSRLHEVIKTTGNDDFNERHTYKHTDTHVNGNRKSLRWGGLIAHRANGPRSCRVLRFASPQLPPTLNTL